MVLKVLNYLHNVSIFDKAFQGLRNKKYKRVSRCVL